MSRSGSATLDEDDRRAIDEIKARARKRCKAVGCAPDHEGAFICRVCYARELCERAVLCQGDVRLGAPHRFCKRCAGDACAGCQTPLCRVCTRPPSGGLSIVRQYTFYCAPCRKAEVQRRAAAAADAEEARINELIRVRMAAREAALHPVVRMDRAPSGGVVKAKRRLRS